MIKLNDNLSNLLVMQPKSVVFCQGQGRVIADIVVKPDLPITIQDPLTPDRQVGRVPQDSNSSFYLSTFGLTLSLCKCILHSYNISAFHQIGRGFRSTTN